jgi:hypothetical protein
MTRQLRTAALLGAVLLTGAGAAVWGLAGRDGGTVAAAGGMTAQEFSMQSPLLLPAMLQTVYEAFGETEEAAIYDGLAQVASGAALEQLYLERVGAMAGGGLNPDQQIHEVALLDMSARPSGGSVQITARWRVLGVVGHAEHMHMRGNAYSADLAMSPVEDAWKLTGFTLRDVDRTGAGTLERNADAPPLAAAQDDS